MTADRSTDPLWVEETADRAKDWSRRDKNAGYPGEDLPQIRKPKWDADGNCTVLGCEHPQAEHGIRGCKHRRGEMDTCWCAVGGAS